MKRIAAAMLIAAAVWPTGRLHAQAHAAALPGDTLATYGSQVITSGDFLERFELMPWPMKDNKARIELTKQEFLQSLVAEKLLALEAQHLGLGTDTASQEMQHSLQRMFTRDEVYKRDVLSKIRVTPEQIREGMRRYPYELSVIVYGLVSKSEGDLLLKKVAQSRNKTRTFEQFRDSLYTPLDTVTANFGDLEPAVERAAYELKVGALSKPFDMGPEGWRMLKLVDKHANPTYAKQSAPDQIAGIRRIVSRRQEDSIAARVFAGYLAPQRAEGDPRIFKELADSALGIMQRDSAGHFAKNLFMLKTDDLERLERNFGPRCAELFITMQSGAMTLGEVVNGLKYNQVVFPSLKPNVVQAILNNNIKTVIQNELIAREGVKRNYQQSENVRHDLGVWMDSRRSRLLTKAVTDTVTVTDEDVEAYARTRGAKIADSVKQNVREKVLEEKKQRTLDRYVGGLARKYRVSMDNNRLRSVKTTTTSMVTWRTIGFGGRILAVPMAAPETQWVREMEPQKNINQ